MRYRGHMPSELLSSWDKAKPRDPATLIPCLWQRLILDAKPEQPHLTFPTLFSLLSVWSGEGDISSYSWCYLSLYLQLSSGKSPVTTKRFSYNCFSCSNLLLLISQGKTAWAFFLCFPFWSICWSTLSVPNELFIFLFAIIFFAILHLAVLLSSTQRVRARIGGQGLSPILPVRCWRNKVMLFICLLMLSQ